MTTTNVRTICLAWVTLVFVLLPRIVLACPQCAGNERASSWGKPVLYVAFVLLPFGIVTLVVRIIRRLAAGQPTWTRPTVKPK